MGTSNTWVDEHLGWRYRGFRNLGSVVILPSVASEDVRVYPMKPYYK